MLHAPIDLVHRLRQHGQDHLLAGWEDLNPEQRCALVESLAGISFAELETLYQRKDEPHAALPARERIAPLPVATAEEAGRARHLGEAVLREGEVAVLLVAGGQGSRLGFEKPKGLYPVGPVSGATLFQIHAEKVLALSRRYGRLIPFLIMTSPATHADTESFFRAHGYFDLSPQQVSFFQQGTMPALDLDSGRLLLEAPGRLFLSPNGHGGTLTALADSGLLAELESQQIRHVFYFQVDNPLVKIADPAFLGLHVQADSEVSSKVVYKELPGERVGVLACIDGRCGIIEYSDMPEDMTEERGPDGRLTFRAGNPAIHLFSVPFLRRVSTGTQRLHYHVARKKVAYYDPAAAATVNPSTENALKLELFIFDALPLADRWLAVETVREEEFAPLKNATGADSIETCRRMQIELATRWLRSVGAVVAAGVPVEISPLYALEPADLTERIRPGEAIDSPRYFR